MFSDIFRGLHTNVSHRWFPLWSLQFKLWCPAGLDFNLSTFLFPISIIDLPNCLSNCQPRLYADDTLLTDASDNALDIQGSLSTDLENVHNWLRTDEPILMNMTKTELTLFSSDLGKG